MASTKKITNAQCLAAARKALAEHADLRPATAAERARIAASYTESVVDFGARATAARVADQSYTACVYDDAARRARLHAQAWADATDTTYDETLAAFAARVAYYEART